MSRDTRGPIAMGPCDCPNTPHGTDTCMLWDRLTAGDVRRIRASQIIINADSFGLADAMILWRSIASWTKSDEQGQPVPVTLEAVDELSPRQASAVLAKLNQPSVLLQYLEGTVLPNPFGGPSADGPAEPTPTSPPSDPPISPTTTETSSSS